MLKIILMRRVTFLWSKPFSDLQFKYEEDNPADFFTPYIWSLIFNLKNIFYFNPQKIVLFSLENNVFSHLQQDASQDEDVTDEPSIHY
jgi:hypothetical protein